MSKSGFIYVWFDRKNNRYYVGSHWGTETDSYICSSKWMRDAYRNRPHDFKRRIIIRGINDRKQLFLEEQRWLNMIKPTEMKPQNPHPRYYNLCITVKDPWYQHADKVKTIGQKISAAKKGKNTGPRPESVGKAISEAKKRKFVERGGISEEHKRAIQKAAKDRNYKHTEEWKIENSRRMKEQWNDGTRKRTKPKPKITKEEQAKLSSERLKKNWADLEWRVKQQNKLKEGAKNRPPRTEESKMKTSMSVKKAKSKKI